MKFFNHRSRNQHQWQEYQALEMLPAAIQRSQGPMILPPIVNAVTRIIVALRPVAFYSGRQVDHLEKCWNRQLEPSAAIAADTAIQTPTITQPMLWIMDGNFDGTATKPASPHNPPLIPPHFWAMDD